MIVDLSEIPPEGRIFRGNEPAEVLDLGQETDLWAVSPVGYEFRADLVADELIIRGKLGVSIEFTCSRCAETFLLKVSEPDFVCVRDIRAETEAESGASGGKKSRQPAAEKPRCVDLTGDIREAILLGFPSHPVCRSDCKGLCSQCGANLNSSPCDCRPPEDERWGALDGLVV